MSQRILAIDDSLTFRKFISKALGGSPAQYDVSLACDGTEGLTKALSEKPDLILLDYVMPDLSGEEVCARLAQALNGETMPVVLMSSSVEAITATQARFEFVKGAVAKPFTPELLCDTVEQVLGDLGVTGQNSTAPVTSPSVGFSAGPATMSIITALLAVQRQRGSGKLAFVGGNKSLTLLCDQGAPAAIIHDGRTLDCWDGLRYAGWIWTGGVDSFVFTPGDFAKKPADGVENILEWAMESTRMVGDEAESSYAWGDNSGVPAFNRVGYERIQRVALTEEEIDFVKLVDARSSLERIAQQLGWPIKRAQQVLFRFLSLEIFDFWPSAILNANRR
jgi:CheY-like chemotaxis protein